MRAYFTKKISLANLGKKTETITCNYETVRPYLVLISFNSLKGVIAIGGADGLLKVIKLEDNAYFAGVKETKLDSVLALNQTLDGHHHQVHNLSWNCIHNRLTSVDASGLIIVWMRYQGVWYEEMINDAKVPIICVRWCHGGGHILILNEKGQVIYGSVEGNRIWAKEFIPNSKFIQSNPESTHFLLVTPLNRINIYDIVTGIQAPDGEMYISPQISTSANIIGLEWYDATRQESNYLISSSYRHKRHICIIYSDKTIQLSKSPQDTAPIVIQTDIEIRSAKYSNDGSILAVAGVCIINEDLKEFRKMIYFYDTSGNVLSKLTVKGNGTDTIKGISWDNSGLRIMVILDTLIYFADVVYDYLWSYMRSPVPTVVYSYYDVKNEVTRAVFWNLVENYEGFKTNTIICKGLVLLASCNEYALFVFDEDLKQYFQVRNCTGKIIMEYNLPFTPKYACITDNNVFLSNARYAYILNLKTKEESFFEPVFNSDMEVGSKITLSVYGSFNEFTVSNEPIVNSITSMTACDTFVLFGYESGMQICQYFIDSSEFLLGVNCASVPHTLQLNCNLTKICVLTPENKFFLVDITSFSIIQPSDVVGHWRAIWSHTDPEKLMINKLGIMMLYENGVKCDDVLYTKCFYADYFDVVEQNKYDCMRLIMINELMATPSDPPIKKYIVDRPSFKKIITSDHDLSHDPENVTADNAGADEFNGNILSEILNEGQKEWNRCKIMIVGEGRAGKTALSNSIIGKDFAETESTVGIAQLTCDVKFATTNNGGVWSECAKQEKVLESAIASMMKAYKKNTPQQDAAEDIGDEDGNEASPSGANKSVTPKKVIAESSSPIKPDNSTNVGDKQTAVALSSEAPTENVVKSDHVITSVEENTANTPVTETKNSKYIEVNEELVMKCLGSSVAADSDVVMSLFDYGGQTIFNVIHHLFLTKYGIYALVFNMEWIVKEGNMQDTCLAYMHFWLNSIVVHTLDSTTNTVAPIVIVGTRLDQVSDPSSHQMISDLLQKKFYYNQAWPSVLENNHTTDSQGNKRTLCFFPVNNVEGRRDISVQNLLKEVESTIDHLSFTHMKVPLKWLKVLDDMQELKKSCMSFKEVEIVSIGMQKGEIRNMLNLYHQMGILMWHDEPGLSDTIVMDAVTYLVDPATVIICRLSRDKDDGTMHTRIAHKKCAKYHQIDWTNLSENGLLNEQLLPVLWEPFKDQTDKLLLLMTKFGLLVPLTNGANDKYGSKQYLVPALLPPTSEESKALYSRWTDSSYQSFAFIFTTSKELALSSTITCDDLRKFGFLPSGLFERVVGNSVAWSQTTTKMANNLSGLVLNKEQAILVFGRQRFKLTLCNEIHGIWVEVEGKNPIVVQERLLDLIMKILNECMKSLLCVPCVPYKRKCDDQSDANIKLEIDELQAGISKTAMLIPLEVLRDAAKNESVLCRPGGRRLWSSDKEILDMYDEWLQLYDMKEKYDIFVSYRWSRSGIPYDDNFVVALFDAFTSHVVGDDHRAVDVFLDRKRLKSGRRFDLDFCAAMFNSVMVTPILSVEALLPLTQHDPSKIDNMLTEWILCLLCYKSKKSRVSAVFPIAFGERANCDELTDSNSKPKSIFSSKILHDLPRIFPAATVESIQQFLKEKDFEPEFFDYLNRITVHSVVTELSKFLLLQSWKEDSEKLVVISAEQALDVFKTASKQAAAIDSIVSAASSKPTSPVRVVKEKESEPVANDGGDTCESQLSKIWDMLQNEKLHIKGMTDQLKELLDDLGVYSPEDLGSLGNEHFESIEQLLKVAQRPKFRQLAMK